MKSSAGASDPGSWNRYAYVQGDPINFNDPAGLLAAGISTLPGYDPTAQEPVECPDSDELDYYVDGSFANSACLSAQATTVALVPKKPSRTYFPSLRGSNLSAAQGALKLAESYASNPKCDSAMATYGIASLDSLLGSLNISSPTNPYPAANVFDGMASSFPGAPGGQQVADYLQQHSGSVGAISQEGTAAMPGLIFLGAAFYDPSIAGGSVGYNQTAQALILMHEAVHAIGNLSDAQGGGSKNITQTIINNCIPVLAGKLGGLYH
jgi:hypothetical protein